MNIRTDLSTDLGGFRIKNPVMPASGTYEYTNESARLFPLERLGAIVVKSVNLHPRQGNPGPRIIEVPNGMINAVGIPSVGLPRFLTEELPPLRRHRAPVVLSVSGECGEDYRSSAELLTDNRDFDALELNLSCPNVGTGLPFSSEPELMRATIAPVRDLIKQPIFVKLTPMVADITRMAGVAEECGVNAVVIANTFPSMVIDVKKRKPVLGNTFGGMSGPCIKPLVMKLVYQAYERIHIPIIACGGIASAADAVEYLLAGATALQIGSMNFVNPLIMPEVIAGIDEYLYENGFYSVKEIIGLAHA